MPTAERDAEQSGDTIANGEHANAEKRYITLVSRTSEPPSEEERHVGK